MADDSGSSLSYKKDQKKTVTSFDSPPDARSLKGAGTYPNYYSQKTRSGHSFTLDDSEGAESITLQHRSGSMFQCLPDGAMQFVSHNGQYTVVFGENRMHITGAYDVVVNGGGSLRVDGDYNVTVMGNHNTTVNGDMNITAKNMNTVVRGNMDTSAKNMTTKVEGSTQISTEGVTTIDSDGGLSMSSSSAPVSILGQGDVGIGTTGKLMLHSGQSTHIKSSTALNLEAEAKLSLKAGGIVGIDGDETWLQSKKADPADEMEIYVPIPVNPNPNFGGPR